MRKLVSLGLFALILSIFSSQLLASNVAACDAEAGPGLHGLCVAWHNANEKNKEKIAAKYRERGGGDVPGSGTQVPDSEPEPDPEPFFDCLCWADLSLDEVCSLGAPTSVMLFGFLNVVQWEDDNDVAYEFFNAGPTGCIYEGQFEDLPQILDPLDQVEELPACVAEIEAIASLYASEACSDLGY